MRTTSHRWAISVLAVTLVAGLTACNGGDETPPITSTKSSSTTGSTATTSTTTAPPTTTRAVAVPPEATKHTEAGAVRFARYFTQQMDEAGLSADSSSLRQLSDSECGGCQVAIKIADELKVKNQHHKATTFTIAGAYRRPESTDTSTVVDVLVDDAGSSTVDASGNVVAESSPSKLTFRHSLEWRDSGWVVSKSVLVQ